MRLFGRHRVRATFYHTVAVIFLFSTALWAMGLMSDKVSFIVTAVLFVVDYLAEMYDPHPDAPGPWFKTHFHRFLNLDEEEPCYYERYLAERADKIKALAKCPIS